MPKHTFTNGKLSIRADMMNPREKAAKIKNDVQTGKGAAKYTKEDLLEALKQQG